MIWPIHQYYSAWPCFKLVCVVYLCLIFIRDFNFSAWHWRKSNFFQVSSPSNELYNKMVIGSSLFCFRITLTLVFTTGLNSTSYIYCKYDECSEEVLFSLSLQVINYIAALHLPNNVKKTDNLSLQSSSEQALTTKKSRVSSISPHLKCVNWHRPLTPLSASSSQKCKHPQLFPDSSLEGSDLAGPFQLFGDVVSTIVCTIVLCTTTSLLYCWKWSSMDFTKLLPSFNTSKKPALSL